MRKWITMALLTLTEGDDNLVGTSGADSTWGPIGGVDTLQGLGGNDTFILQSGIDAAAQGTIDGGAGWDLVQVWTPSGLGTVGLVNVEKLDSQAGILDITLTQLSAFQLVTSTGHYGPWLALTGEGGLLDLSGKLPGSKMPNPLGADGKVDADLLTC